MTSPSATRSSSPVEGWVERLDPESLGTSPRPPRLPGGKYWPGGIAAHRNGDLHMVFGRWAHRLSPGLEVLASHRLPVERPHNSFVVLDGGELVTKDCDAPPGRVPSTLSVLDPETLLPVAPTLELPEPCIARLASDGDSVIAVGTETVLRLRLDRDAGRIVIDESWRPRYGPAPRSQLRLGPGDHRGPCLLDGQRPQPNRQDDAGQRRGRRPGEVVVGAPRRRRGVRSVEISGLPFGTESNPPGWDPVGGIVIAYDAGNAVLRAWRLIGDELEPLWRRDSFAHAGHLIVYPDTRELVAQDWRDQALLRRPGLRRALRPVFQLLSHSARVRRGLAPGRQRPARRPRPRQRRGEGACGRSLAQPGFPLPGARLRSRHLLPVADHDRPGRGRLR